MVLGRVVEEVRMWCKMWMRLWRSPKEGGLKMARVKWRNNRGPMTNGKAKHERALRDVAEEMQDVDATLALTRRKKIEEGPGAMKMQGDIVAKH